MTIQKTRTAGRVVPQIPVETLRGAQSMTPLSPLSKSRTGNIFELSFQQRSMEYRFRYVRGRLITALIASS
jgi:hypothetical protein